jgi:HSP20 family molecular chaperone IbpA
MIDPKNAYDMLTGNQGPSDFSREFYEFSMPAMDMCEDDDTNELIVKIDLPGYAKKDIRLSIDRYFTC